MASPPSTVTEDDSMDVPRMPKTVDEARAIARDRFKQRLENGESIGNCSCHTDEVVEDTDTVQARQAVAGVRFLDSGRTYFFDATACSVDVGDWVVVETSRGQEAARVVLAPNQVRLNLLDGEPKPILRRLSDDDVDRMKQLKRDAASAVKTFGIKIRERALQMKPISAEYTFDGSQLVLNFSAPERVDFRELARDLSAHFHCRVELKQVGPRDEARLLGGLGRCGRTLCCASWLPVYPEISMNMAKSQDLPLNPSKVSGVCGRLLCCLSYENEQYKQAKAIMPRLGQTIETPRGPGLVISLQILKELVTIRLQDDNSEHVFAVAELGFGQGEAQPQAKPSSQSSSMDSRAQAGTGAGATLEGGAADGADEKSGTRRRRRRGRGKPRSEQPVA
jgi:cell fate regulator YaaT (PSP1 superfamily)